MKNGNKVTTQTTMHVIRCSTKHNSWQTLFHWDKGFRKTSRSEFTEDGNFFLACFLSCLNTNISQWLRTTDQQQIINRLNKMTQKLEIKNSAIVVNLTGFIMVVNKKPWKQNKKNNKISRCQNSEYDCNIKSISHTPGADP